MKMDRIEQSAYHSTMRHSPDQPKASIIEVAELAGVSRATAARALGKYGSVSAKSLKKVEAAAAELGYTANSVARSIKTGRTLTLGALVADMANPFFARLLRGFSDGAEAAGYDVMLVNTDETTSKEVRGLQMLTEKRADGILIAPAGLDSYEHLTTAVARGQAIVQVDRFIPDLAADRVVVDNYEASYSAVKRVIEIGHELIACPTLNSSKENASATLTTTMERHQGYLDAMADAGLKILDGFTPTGRGREAVGKILLELLDSELCPTAIFALDNSFMLGSIDAVRSLNLSIPDELSVFGFDDLEWATIIEPPLSVIDQPAYELGMKASEVLVRRIEDRERPLHVEVMPTTWIERGSISPPPRNVQSAAAPASTTVV